MWVTLGGVTFCGSHYVSLNFDFFPILLFLNFDYFQFLTIFTFYYFRCSPILTISQYWLFSNFPIFPNFDYCSSFSDRPTVEPFKGPFQCYRCGEMIKAKSAMKTHIKEYHCLPFRKEFFGPERYNFDHSPIMTISLFWLFLNFDNIPILTTTQFWP